MLYNSSCFNFSSVTACWQQLEWVLWLRMRHQCQPARQKSQLQLNDNSNISTVKLLPDVFLMLNVMDNKIQQWIQEKTFCNKWTLISKYWPVTFCCTHLWIISTFEEKKKKKKRITRILIFFHLIWALS